MTAPRPTRPRCGKPTDANPGGTALDEASLQAALDAVMRLPQRWEMGRVPRRRSERLRWVDPTLRHEIKIALAAYLAAQRRAGTAPQTD